MKNKIISSLLIALFSSSVFAANTQSEISFKKEVQPILHDYCLSCHEPGGKGYEKNGLDMRTYESLMKGTKFGTVINPGNSFTSIIVQAVEGRVHASLKMPYGMSGGLAKDKISLLKKWVDQGAKDN